MTLTNVNQKTKFLITIFAVLIYCTACLGQAKDSMAIKRRTERQVKVNQQDDSLRNVFYSIPQYFSISLEIDHKRVPIPDKARFYAISHQRTIQPKVRRDNRFEFGDLPDSLQFTMEFDSIKLTSGYINESHYKNGAAIRFGYYSNILQLKQILSKGKKDKYFDAWTEIGDPYLSAIKDKKIIRAAKNNKIKPIEFVALSPRVYGDGVTITFQNIKLK